MDKRYLDIEGSKHLTNKLKEYIQSKINDIPSGGTVDLSNYYTKAEVNNIVSNISGGSSGTGVGIANMKLVNYELIITLTDGTEHNLGNVRGEKGAKGDKGDKGEKGADGINGFSPTVEVTNITDGHKVTITDKNGIKSFDVKDGKNGTSGSGAADLSGYYTKSEVDSKLKSIEVEPTKDLLYETVVANGGAVKNVEEVEFPTESKLSDVIIGTQNGAEITGNDNGNFYVQLKNTQEQLNAEFSNVQNDSSLIYVLASSFKGSFDKDHDKEFINRLKKGEKLDWITVSRAINREDYIIRIETLYWNTDKNKYEKHFVVLNDWSGISKYNIIDEIKNIKYICSGTYYTEFSPSLITAQGYNSEISFYTKYIPTNTTYTNRFNVTFSENVSTEEFSKHILDTYLSHETIKSQKITNYSLAEWGDKLDNVKNGTNGTDGVSPTVSVTEKTNGHTVSITDVNGTQSFDVTNGTNGTDGTNGTNGVSPTVTVTKEGKVATSTCTDVNGTTTATISDGKDGASGGSSGGGSAITYAYDTEIATGETWVDGKPIYLKVFHVDKLASAPSDCITYDNYFTDIAPFADKFISVEPLWSRTSNKNTFSGNVMQAFQPPYSENTSGLASCVKDNMLSYTAWVQAWQGSTNFGMTVCRGKNMWQYSVDIFVKYTKL